MCTASRAPQPSHSVSSNTTQTMCHNVPYRLSMQCRPMMTGQKHCSAAMAKQICIPMYSDFPQIMSESMLARSSQTVTSHDMYSARSSWSRLPQLTPLCTHPPVHRHVWSLVSVSAYIWNDPIRLCLHKPTFYPLSSCDNFKSDTTASTRLPNLLCKAKTILVLALTPTPVVYH